MAGSGSIDLWLSSTAADTDVQVTLGEIRPDGMETYVQNGWLRASHTRPTTRCRPSSGPVQTHREEDAAPLPSGDFALARVELFPFAHAFRAGSAHPHLGRGAGRRPRALWKFRALDANGDVK